MSKPFIVVGGQVYLNAALIAEAAVESKIVSTQADIVKVIVGGKLFGSNRLLLDFKTGEFRFEDRLGS